MAEWLEGVLHLWGGEGGGGLVLHRGTLGPDSSGSTSGNNSHEYFYQASCYSPGSVLGEYHIIFHLILSTTLIYQYYYSLLSQMRKPRVSFPNFTAVKMQGAFLAPSCPSSPSKTTRSGISALELYCSCKPLYQQKLFAELELFTVWSLL